MKKNIIITAVILVLALFATISAMSGDGGQQPVKPEKETEAVQEITQDTQQSTTAVGQKDKDNQTKKERKAIPKEKLGIVGRNNDPLPEALQRDERFPVKTIQTKKDEFSYYKAKNGDIWGQDNRCLLDENDIIKDEQGSLTVLNRMNKINTGLNVDQYIEHMLEYECRILEILEEKGIDSKSVSWSTGMWYNNRVNLDKLDELKENGFDALPERGFGLGYGDFPELAITSEKIVIGKVVESISQDYEKTGFESKLKIKVDETLKPSENAAGSFLECLYHSNLGWDSKIPLNAPVVISLKNPLGLDKARLGLLTVSIWYDIIDDVVNQNKNSPG